MVTIFPCITEIDICSNGSGPLVNFNGKNYLEIFVFQAVIQETLKLGQKHKGLEAYQGGSDCDLKVDIQPSYGKVKFASLYIYMAKI